MTVDQALTLTFQSTPPSREATRALIALDEYYGPFQSTPPSREATRRARILSISAAFQSTPPSREATPSDLLRSQPGAISIHASLAGGDPIFIRYTLYILRISIHASLAGGDADPGQPRHHRDISIHASLAGGDL